MALNPAQIAAARWSGYQQPAAPTAPTTPRAPSMPAGDYWNDPVFQPPGTQTGYPPVQPAPGTVFLPPGGGSVATPSPGGGSGVSAPAAGEPTQAELERQERQSQIAGWRAALTWLPADLIDLFIQAWVQHGAVDLAWGQVRQSPQYKVHFPHMFRPDKTMRFNTELEYMTWFEGQRRNFAEWGINAGLHEDVIVSWLEGDLSVAEANQRLGAFAAGIMRQGDTIRGQFAEFYGPDSGLAAADDRSLVSMALKPQLASDLFHGRITAAQIAGEAATRGFDRGRERAEDLVFRGGLDQARARQLFSQAATAVPQFGRFAQRFHDPSGGFGIEQFEEAAVFGDPAERERMRRLSASERALFSSQAGVRRDDYGLAGLTRR